MRTTEARWNLRETGRECEEQEKLEKERVEKMFEPASLRRGRSICSQHRLKKESVQRFHAQAPPDVKDIT